MTDQQNDTSRAVALGAYLVQRQNRALENVRQQYANDKYHDFNVVKEDALARREEFRANREHKAQLALEESISKLSQEIVELERSGDKEAAKAKKMEISQLRNKGVGEDAFDTDAITQNFAKTLDEVIEDFGEASRDEMKVSIKRMSALMDSIEASNAVEKDFLLEQYRQTQDAMQKEFNKRASIAARATEKMSELGEQYLDIQSLYAGFVDHNPIMMAMFRMGADFIKRSREMKKAQRNAMVRDKKNQAYAEKLNKEKELRAKIEQARDDQINKVREQTAKVNSEAAEENKKQAKKKSKSSADVEPVDDFDASSFFDGIRDDDDDSPTIQREERTGGFNFPQDEYSDTGDEPLTADMLASIFGSTDEDGDPTGFFDRDEDEPEPVNIDDTEPLNVKVAEDTPEQKAQSMFIRQDAEAQQRANEEARLEQVQHNEAMLGKLGDIETAILDGNKIAEKNGKSLEDVGSGGGLLEALGLGRIAAMFKGPILKALMLFGPAVTAIGALLAKLGMGGIAGKLTGGFDNLTERMGGDRNARTDRANNRRGGRFQRLRAGASNVGSRVGGAVRSGGGMLARGAGMIGRGAMGLLGTTAGAVTAAGAAGYGVGTLINDHVLSDETKEGIGDFIGPKIDSVLSFFGNDEAKRRLEYLEKMKEQNGQTLGTAPTPVKKTAAESMGLDNYDKVPNSASVMEKKSSGNQLVIQADNINSNKVINTKGTEKRIEVPVPRQTVEKLNMMETKLTQLQEAKDAANRKVMSPPPPRPSKQTQVKSAPSATPPPSSRSARNPDSSIQRLTDRFVGMGMA